MRIYVVGGSKRDIAEISAVCRENGWEFKTARPFGRPKVEVPVQKVLDIYRSQKNIRSTARKLDLSPGTVQRIVKMENTISVECKKRSDLIDVIKGTLFLST